MNILRSVSFSALTLEAPKALEPIAGRAAANRDVRSRQDILFVFCSVSCQSSPNPQILKVSGSPTTKGNDE